MIRRLAAVAVLALGCGTPRWAVVDGKRVDRPSFGYSDGHHYALEHRRAFPAVFGTVHARDLDDGRIVGRACGLELDFDVTWYGSRLSLVGRADVPWLRDFTRTEGLLKLDLDVTEPAPGRRLIRGSIPGAMAFRIDLDASPERLVGDIGTRHYDLAADGRYLRGHMTGLVQTVAGPRRVDEPLVLYGRDALATMAPADEALLLVSMLSCKGVSLDVGDQKLRGFSLVPLP